MCDSIADNSFGLRLCYENSNGLKFAVVKCMACNLIDDMIEKLMVFVQVFQSSSKSNFSFNKFGQNMWDLFEKKVESLNVLKRFKI